MTWPSIGCAALPWLDGLTDPGPRLPTELPTAVAPLAARR